VKKTTARLGSLLLLMTMVLLESCGGRSSGAFAVPAGSGSMASSAMTAMPKSISPALVAAPPMAQTRASAMTSLRLPASIITPVGFTQLPGAGVAVAASPDGSVWVLSTQGGPVDKAIYHYVNGTWTNIPGAAMRIAVGPDNTLWAVNSMGGIYSYMNGAWSTIAGGASDITVGADGSVYAVSSIEGGPYGNGIWHYVSGTWTQLPGAGVRIAASWDTATCNKYNVAAGSFYVVNAQQSIFSYNPTLGYTQVTGAAIQVAPTANGGLFVLGVPGGPLGNPVYYDDLVSGSWTQQSGAGVSIATNSSNLYVIGTGGGIYRSPVSTLGVNLNCAANFAILAGSAITSTGPSIITGDIGLSPGSSVGGFPPAILNGTLHVSDPAAQQAQLDLTKAYIAAAAMAGSPTAVSGNIGGLTLAPGLYTSSTSLAISSGDLTLDAGGNPNAVFVFQVGSSLTVTSARMVILSGGAKAANIYWAVGSSATLGTTSVFNGNLLVSQSITLQTGATLNGRALTEIGSVTLDSSTITVPAP
jgi:hypothetical protein